MTTPNDGSVHRFSTSGKTKIFVIAGPSGTGKSTLIQRLLKEFPDKFGFSVSHTSRKPRPGEEHGKNYYFTDRESILRDAAAGLFIETAEYSGNLYGTSIKAVEDVVSSGKVCLLDIDMQGVQSVKKTSLNPTYIFLRPPSMEILEQRLRGRGDTDEASIQRRLTTAKKEIDFVDAQPKGYFDYIIINDDLDRAYTEFRAAIAGTAGFL